MKRKDVAELKHGLYRVYWKSGPYSLAAIGSNSAGEKWLAPTNWIKVCHHTTQKIWKHVKMVKRLDGNISTGWLRHE